MRSRGFGIASAPNFPASSCLRPLSAAISGELVPQSLSVPDLSARASPPPIPGVLCSPIVSDVSVVPDSDVRPFRRFRRWILDSSCALVFRHRGVLVFGCCRASCPTFRPALLCPCASASGRFVSDAAMLRASTFRSVLLCPCASAPGLFGVRMLPCRASTFRSVFCTLLRHWEGRCSIFRGTLIGYLPAPPLAYFFLRFPGTLRYSIRPFRPLESHTSGFKDYTW